MQNIRSKLGEEQFTPVQVAKIMGVKPATVYAYISRKELPSLKVGHSRFISQRNIQAFYDRRNSGEFTDYRYAHDPN